MSDHSPAQVLDAALPPQLADVVARDVATFAERAPDYLTWAADPQWCASIPVVFAASEFVSKTCIANPAVLRELVTSGALQRPHPPGALADALAEALTDSADEPSLQAALRKFRRCEALRLAWRDLAGWADLHEVMATMSDLADACIQNALERLYAWSCAARGTPLGAASGEPVQLSVLALGKLGGRELNFSSDVDLMFTYAEEGETDGPRPISNHEFFTRLGRSLIKTLDAMTEDGFVFRVDLRLRPNGDSGPLVLSFDATEHYYQTHGRDWERYALIKARPVAGGCAAGHRLLGNLMPFVYRKYLDYGAFESIRSMKNLIERELSRKGMANHIKLGKGGIREIEFIAQSFQLIRGGRDRRLQDNRLLPTLAQLGDSGVIPAPVCVALKEAYVRLRGIEHRLQMLEDQQTHRLPTRELPRARIAWATRSASWEVCEAAIQATMQSVHDHFQDIFATTTDPAQDQRTVQLQDLWLGRLEGPGAVKALGALGYDDPSQAAALIESLRRGKAYHAHSKYGRERVDRLMPLVIGACASAEHPVEALSRLIRLIESIGRRSAYLALLVENPLALTQLVKLCTASSWVSSWISRYPILLDELLDPISAEKAGNRADLESELAQLLTDIDAGDLEGQMHALREVRHAQVLKVATADVSGLIDAAEVGARLSQIADVIVAHGVRCAELGLQRKLGTPTPEAGAEAQFGVVGYGKLGSLELGYNSDLDIVFLYAGAASQGMTAGGSRSIPNAQYYGRLGQRIVHILTTRTSAGSAYDLDMRLRPSGRAGALVTSLEAYRDYQLHKAWTWEHQALVRARMVTGPEPLQQAFEALRRGVLCLPREAAELQQEIVAMRHKMVEANDQSTDTQFDLKLGRGGIVDIEFIVQYYVLRWAHEYPELTIPRNNLELLARLESLGLIPASEQGDLASAYSQYLSIDHRRKLAEQPSVVADPGLKPVRNMVEGYWQRIFSQSA